MSFWGHIWGVDRVAGVAMHMGHYQNLIHSSIKMKFPMCDGFFNPTNWREYITSATACRMLSTPSSMRAPCCSCKFLGGDGTAIGIQKSVIGNVVPAWEPKYPSKFPSKKWGRLERCGIQSLPIHSAVEKRDLQDARNIVLELTNTPGPSQELHAELRNQLEAYKDHLGHEFFVELQHWSVMTRYSAEYKPLRSVLRAMAKQDSISGIVWYGTLDTMFDVLQMGFNYCNDDIPINTVIWNSNLRLLSYYGMGPEIARCLDAQLNAGKIRLSFLNFLKHVGE